MYMMYKCCQVQGSTVAAVPVAKKKAESKRKSVLAEYQRKGEKLVLYLLWSSACSARGFSYPDSVYSLIPALTLRLRAWA
jgi:hypothetical protein